MPVKVCTHTFFRNSSPMTLIGRVMVISPYLYNRCSRFRISIYSFCYLFSDSFTDTAISKYNGQVQEKELQPWDGDECGTDGGIEEFDSSAPRPAVRNFISICIYRAIP